MIVPFFDEKQALDVFENITDDTTIFVPIKWSESLGKEAMFVETGLEKEVFLVKIFLTRDDAAEYKKQNEGKVVSLAKTKIFHLTKILRNRYGDRDDKKIHCVIFAKDIENKFHPIDIVWSSCQHDN